MPGPIAPIGSGQVFGPAGELVGNESVQPQLAGPPPIPDMVPDPGDPFPELPIAGIDPVEELDGATVIGGMVPAVADVPVDPLMAGIVGLCCPEGVPAIEVIDPAVEGIDPPDGPMDGPARQSRPDRAAGSPARAPSRLSPAATERPLSRR